MSDDLPSPYETEKKPLDSVPSVPKKFWITPDGSRSEWSSLPRLDMPAKPKRPDEELELSSTDRPTPNPSRGPLKREVSSSPLETTPTAPSGLDRFRAVKGKPGIAIGEKPSLDGLDGLKKAKYRTFVYLHDPKRDVAPVKQLCEARGITFVSIPLGPENFAMRSRAFDDAIASESTPLFACDDASGERLSAAWYAHFRRVDILSADAAEVRTNALIDPSRFDRELARDLRRAADAPSTNK